MGKIKINLAIKKLIEKSVLTNHRSIFFLYGKNSAEQVMVLHHLLASSRRDPPSVLWCFKKKLFTTFNEKRIKKLSKMYKGSDVKPTKEDMFDHFVVGAGVQFCHYSESARVLGQSFGLVVLQDLSALTPNLLARTVECVEGGGGVVFLLPPEMEDPSQLDTLHLDAHERLVTEAFPCVTPRFLRRLLRSPLPPCCLLLDDRLRMRCLPPGFQQHLAAQEDVREVLVPEVSREFPAQLQRLLQLCRTAGQRGALPALREALERGGVAAVTSARGRGKSALLGLALALGLSEGRAAAVSSPHLDNLQTLFKFAQKGLEKLDAKDLRVEHTPDGLVCGLRLGARGRVRYFPPREVAAQGVDLVVLDEAAAIPLPLVKRWLSAAEHCVYMASTVNGYEGTGRSLSLKLIDQLRIQSTQPNGMRLWELELSEAVRYADGDPVEGWLDRLLCLHPPVESLLDCQPPLPHQCQLYAVDRDLLFAGGEAFLQRLVGLFVTSHYNNSPNDLLLMADAPAHSLFCLVEPSSGTLLCAIQVAYEGGMSCSPEMKRASGDMLPWVISQQFLDHSFTTLRGARVVRIATRPDCQGMGYGQHALEQLAQALGTKKKGEAENKGRRHLLTRVQDISRDPLHYLGVSFGLTPQLFRFWKKCGYVPLYIRQTASEVTGEHTCMMVKGLELPRLGTFYSDFVPRFLSLVSTAFAALPPALVLDVVRYDLLRPSSASGEVCRWLFPPEALARLSAFCNRQVELAAVADLLPSLARCHLMRSLPSTLPTFQESVLVSVCLQGKSVDVCAEEVATDPGQVMGALNKALLKLLNAIKANEVNGEQPKRFSDDGSINRHKKLKKFH